MKSPAREALKESFDRYSAMMRQVSDLESAKVSAEAYVETAELEATRYEDLDKEITSHRVKALKSGKDPKSLPADLKVRISARRDAEDECENAHDTLEQVSQELLAAQRELREAKSARSMFAVSVLQEIGDEIAERLLQLNRERLELVNLLNGLAAVQTIARDGNWRFIGHTQRAVEAINLGVEETMNIWPSGVTAEKANAKRWEVRLQALMADPDAAVSIPKPVKPSDVVMVPNQNAGYLLGIPGLAKFDLRAEV